MDAVTIFNYPIIIQSGNFLIWCSFTISIILLIFSAILSAITIAFSLLNKSHIENLRTEEIQRYATVFIMPENKKLLQKHSSLILTCVNLCFIILLFFSVKSILFFPYDQLKGILAICIGIFLIFLFLIEIIPHYIASRNLIQLVNLTAKSFASLILCNKNLENPLTNNLNNHKREENKEEENELVENMLRLDSTEVSEIMVPRVDIFAVENDISFKALLSTIIPSGFSKIPVYLKTLDEIAGVLYIKDVLPHLNKPNNFEWQKLLHKPFCVPETKKIDDLFLEIQASNNKLAFVVDEYGGTSGIITLDDILDEICTKINSTDNNKVFTKLSDTIYVFEGKTNLHDVCKILDLNDDFFDATKGDADTLAGLLLELKGEFPILHEEFSVDNLTFRVESENDRRIKKIQITKGNNNE